MHVTMSAFKAVWQARRAEEGEWRTYSLSKRRRTIVGAIHISYNADPLQLLLEPSNYEIYLLLSI